MPRHWLSFWNQESQREYRDPGYGLASSPGEDLPHIYVPWSEGKLGRGDVVYCLGLNRHGGLNLIARVKAGRLDRRDAQKKTLNVWAEPDSDFYDVDCKVDDVDVDQLVYLKVDGSENHIARKKGRIIHQAFQGKASFRELAAGHELLDAYIEE